MFSFNVMYNLAFCSSTYFVVPYVNSFDLFISFLYYCNKRVFTRMIFKIRSTFQGITISSQIHLYKQKNKVPKRGLRDSHLVPKEDP